MREFWIQYDTAAALALPAAPLSRLLQRRDSDSALLWLAVLGSGGAVSEEKLLQMLGWTEERLQTAARLLHDIGAIGENQPQPAQRPAEPAVRYTDREVAAELQCNLAFRWVTAEAEKKIGRALRKYEAETLFYIYDYLKLPAEVIVVLVGHFARKNGDGEVARSFRFSELKSMARIWAAKPVRTTEEADAMLEQQQRRDSRGWKICRILGITDRRPSRQEDDYISLWIRWDMPDDLIEQAYDKMIAGIGKVSLAYMNRILERWHNEGVRSSAELQKKDEARRMATTVKPAPGEAVRQFASPEEEDAYYQRLWQEYEKETQHEH